MSEHTCADYTFGQAPDWLLKMAITKAVTWADVGVWVAISFKWGWQNGLVWTTRTKMAKELGLTVPTLYRHLKRLETAGALHWEDYEKGTGEKRRMIVLRPFVEPRIRSDTDPMSDLRRPPLKSDPQKKKNKKKKTKEDCAAAYAASHVPLESEEEDREEDREESLEERKRKAEKKRKEIEEREKARLRAAAPPTTAGAAAIDTVPAGEDNGPPRPGSRRGTRSARSGARRPRQTALTNPDVIAAFTTWDDEVKLRWPGGATRKLDKDTAGIVSKLLQKTDLDGLKAIIRLAVWDWLAVQGTIQPWYTKDRPIPDFKAITYIFDALVAKVGTGVTSHKHRVSEYSNRFIKKLKPKEPSADGLTMAERIRFGRGG